jgi:hypothetical protein
MSCFEERDFYHILESVGGVFRKEIRDRGWDVLLYHDPESYFVPQLVDVFYKSFMFEEMSLTKDRIFVNVGEETREVSFELISHITGIPLTSGMMQYPLLSIEDYKLLVGTSGVGYPSGGIDGTSMYLNVFVVCRWLVRNVVSNSHETSFYTPSLYIVYMLMTRNYNFCMCRKLMETICNVKEKENEGKKFTLALPVLVTRIMENWMSVEEKDQWAHSRVYIKKERFLSSYKNTLDMHWTFDMAREDVPTVNVPSDDDEEEAQVEADSDDEIVSYFEETPTDPRMAIPHMAKGMGKMAKMMIKMKNLMKGKPKDKGSTSGGPTLRRSQTESPSTRKRRLG